MTRAIGLFGHDWDPNYYVNPPAYTYLVHLVLGVWYGGRAGVSNSFAADPTQIWIIARTIAARAGHARGLAAVPRRHAARRPPRRPAVGGHLRRRVPAGLLLQARAQRRADAGRRLPRRCGAPPGILRDGRMRDYVLGRARPRPGLRDEVHRRDRAAADRRRRGRAVRGRPAASAGALRGIAIVGVAALASFVVANPYALLDFSSFWDGPDAPVRRLRRRRRQARAHAGLGLRLLPVVVRLGPGLAAAVLRRRRRGAAVLRRAPAVLDARAADHRVRPVHGLPGALLRALAHAGLPVRLRARRLRRDRARRLARADLARRCGRRSSRRRSSCSAGRASSTRCTRASSCRARTRATSPATGWSPTSPAGDEDRRRARRARPVGAGHRQPVAGHDERQPLEQVSAQPQDRPADRRAGARRGRHREHRGLRDGCCTPGSSTSSSSRSTAGSSSARRSAAAPRSSPRSCRRRWPTTRSSSAARRSPTRCRRTPRARARSRSTSTGRSTTTRWPTTGPGRP